MDRLRQAAFVSIGRACGFAGLGILCVMLGLSYDPLLAARTGGALTLGATAVLLIKSHYVPYQDFRNTEIWIMLDKKHLPAEPHMRWAGATVLREAYLWFAKYTAGVSAVLWAAASFLTVFA
jgi:hypothetical protein